jgi:hypothetical protein
VTWLLLHKANDKPPSVPFSSLPLLGARIEVRGDFAHLAHQANDKQQQPAYIPAL